MRFDPSEREARARGSRRARRALCAAAITWGLGLVALSGCAGPEGPTGPVADFGTGPGPEADPGAALLPAERLYCYPNPVEETSTAHVRFHLEREARVRLDVFDAVGVRVSTGVADAELPGPGEHEIAWSVADYASGLYICRVRATTPSGETAEEFVRMAVSR